ncbi:MAG: 3-deoxy-manno-octulosonate cytidylyltransferase [Magnetococcales bacterium]|nr:3-deoxy-manno-octulosonate cytidylyltransferase [Magnetococcales bacterium]
MPVVVIIPARFASSRLPGKPLLDLGGKPMIRHVYERAMQAAVAAVWVATDDRRIFEVVQGFGGRVVMTSSAHLSGTDRVAEAARAVVPAGAIVVNVQGDEPLLEPALIDQVAAPLRQDAAVVMATVAQPLYDLSAGQDPNCVKVVCDRQGFALYFSRLPIPFERDAGSVVRPLLRHVGLYAYRGDFLQTFAVLAPTELEQRERLEQLRVLEHGYRIRVVVVEGGGEAIGVDTPADLQRVRALLVE